MAVDLKGSDQVDSIFIGDDCVVGHSGGVALPHIEVPGAPLGFRYYQADGRNWYKETLGNQISNWKLQNGNSSQCCGFLPFCNADGTIDNIDLVNGEILFCNADGSLDNIALDD